MWEVGRSTWEVGMKREENLDGMNRIDWMGKREEGRKRAAGYGVEGRKKGRKSGSNSWCYGKDI